MDEKLENILEDYRRSVKEWEGQIKSLEHRDRAAKLVLLRRYGIIENPKYRESSSHAPYKTIPTL